MESMYDLIIIGAGPAGLTAAIYAVRYSLKTLVVGEIVGGQTAEVSIIDNYPGVPSVSGYDLAGKMFNQAKDLGTEFLGEQVTSVEKTGDKFKAVTISGKEFFGKTLIVTSGTEPRRLSVPGEERLRGRGVSYCVTCDGPLFRGKTVAVVGGGDAAFMGALDLVGFVGHIYLIVRTDKFRCKPYFLEVVRNNPKVTILTNTSITSINGTNKVGSVTLNNPYPPYAPNSDLPLDGVFVEIGSQPATTLTKQLGLQTDDINFVEVAVDQSTNVAGVFAAGDLTTGSNRMRQIVTATGEAAVAAQSAYRYLQEKQTPNLTKSLTKILINQEKCAACGLCAVIAPETFELDPASGLSSVKNPTGDTLDKIKQAAESCPEGTIKIVE